MVRIVLLSGPALELVHTGELTSMSPMPGVILWGSRYFMFAYRENPESFVYKEVVMSVLL